MRKRRGESLAEFLTASLVFGIIMAGLFEFMANQTENLAMIRDRDDLMFHAYWLSNQTLKEPYDSIKNRNILFHIKNNVSADYVLTTQYYEDKDNLIPKIDATAEKSPVVELEKIVSFDWRVKSHKLTVKNKRTSLSFQLQPADDDS